MTQKFILGGYTRRDNDGLYEVEFNSSDASFKNATLIEELNSPTFVAVSNDKNWLFAIDSNEDGGGLVAFRKEGNSWVRKSQAYPAAGSGCHVTYRAESSTIYVANYHLGTIDVYKLEDDILEHIQEFKNEGSSVHPNQASSHMHFTGLFNEDQYLVACDLGTDEIISFKVDSDGHLEEVSRLEVPAGTGPRHLAFHPELPIAYVIGELNNTTSLLKYSADGSFEWVKSWDNIPSDVKEASGAAIRISNDGKFLYSSTRFYNVITVFEINTANGELTNIQTIDTKGEIPRDFILNEDEKYVLVPHQDSDHISVFERDFETGELSFVNSDFEAKECVCIMPC